MISGSLWKMKNWIETCNSQKLSCIKRAQRKRHLYSCFSIKYFEKRIFYHYCLDIFPFTLRRVLRARHQVCLWPSTSVSKYMFLLILGNKFIIKMLHFFFRCSFGKCNFIKILRIYCFIYHTIQLINFNENENAKHSNFDVFGFHFSST